MQRTLFVGDIHGCLDELQAVLKASGWTKADGLVLLGDLVAKGPDSQGVVACFRELSAQGVLGNHDAHVLKARQGHELKAHHAEVAKSLTEADWRALELLPTFLDFPALDTLAVHGGLVPGVPLAKQEREALINMRSLDEKGRASKKVDGGVPWATRWEGPRFVLFGHDALRGLQQEPHAWGLDTGCVYGGHLSAVWMPERRLVQVKARRAYHAGDRG